MNHKSQRIPISVSEAVDRVLHAVEPHLQTQTEYVPLTQAVGRILQQPIISDQAIPAFDRSAFDGYAVRLQDLQEASSQQPITLPIQTENKAGDLGLEPIQPNHTIRIFTGAPIPPLADAVVMQEIVKLTDDGAKAIFSRPTTLGVNISFRGEDVQLGEVLLTTGEVLDAGKIATLATFGVHSVPVSTKPTIAIFASGNELVEPDQPVTQGKIRNSNAYMLYAQIKQMGAEPFYLGKIPDDFPSTVLALQQALESYDCVITTGGVSVGDYDFILAAHQEIGAQNLFDKVTMRPGSVTSASVRDHQLLFGLSGNPSACFVGCELFVRPWVEKQLGRKNSASIRTEAILQADFPKVNPFTRFVRSIAFLEKGRLVVEPSGKDKSNMIHSLIHANALMVLPGGSRGYQKGDLVEVILLEGGVSHSDSTGCRLSKQRQEHMDRALGSYV